MPAANTDKLHKNAPNFSTSLNGSISAGDTVITLQSTTNLPTDTAVTLVIDATDSNGTLTPTKKEVVLGVVSGTTIVSCLRGLDGTTAQSHTTGATVVGWFTAYDWNALIGQILTQHNQDGSHAALTATSLNASGAVTSGGLLTGSNGLTITGSVSLPGGSVAPAALTGGSSTMLSAWQSFSPTWTNLSVGNGSVAAGFVQIGKTVIGRVRVLFGSTTSISGDVLFTIPASAVGAYSQTSGPPVGDARYLNNGVATYRGFVVFNDSDNTKMRLLVSNVAGTYPTDTALASNVPFTWGTLCMITLNFIYEAT